MKMSLKNQKKQFFKEAVLLNAKVSYSGTSSGVVALAAAKAASLLKSKVFYTTVFVSPFICLNSAHIGIPKLGRCGLKKVTAAGLILKDPSKGLHILNDLKLEHIKKINQLCKTNTKINVEIQYNTDPIYCRVIAVDDKSNVADVVICYEPTLFASVKFNNKQSIPASMIESGYKSRGFDTAEDAISFVSIKDAYELASSFKLNEMKFIDDHIKTNKAICEMGKKTAEKSSIHHHYNEALKYFEKDEPLVRDTWFAQLLLSISAGIDARMNGCPLPTITSATNGDHGIVAVMVPYIYGTTHNIPKEKIYQSIMLSHFITWKISTKIGKLCIMCGTAVAAVAGAIAAIAYQDGWKWEKVEKLLNMHLAQQAGTICYGSSPSCAFQVICAIATAMSSFNLVKFGGFIPDKDGIISSDIAHTLANFKTFTDGTRDIAVNTVVSEYQEKINK